MKRPGGKGGKDLPVDPDRLRRQFPALTDADLEAYEEVTRRILGEVRPEARARLTRLVMQEGRQAREKQAAGSTLSAEESVAVRYLAAVEKMQGRRRP